MPEVIVTVTIPELPDADIPLSGEERVPIFQNGQTKDVAASEFMGIYNGASPTTSELGQIPSGSNLTGLTWQQIIAWATTGAPGVPVINVSPSSLIFGDTSISGFSASQQITVSATGLTSDLIVTSPVNFIINDDNSNTNMSPMNLGIGNISGTIFVKFNPVSVGLKTGSISFVSVGALTKNVSVEGEAVAAILEYFHKYTELNPDTGLDWRDGGNLIPIAADSKLLHFNGWHPGVFPGNDSTTEVLETTTGASYAESADYSPTEYGPRHKFGMGKRSDGKYYVIGGDANDPTGAKEIWLFDPENIADPYSLVIADWGIGTLYSFEAVVDEVTGYIYVFGGQEILNSPYNLNLNIYRSTNGGTSFSVFGTMPAGSYSNGVAYQTTDYIYHIGGATYDEPPINFNDKVTRISKTTGVSTHIATVPDGMISSYPSGATVDGLHYYVKGTNELNANDTGVWTTLDFISFVEIERDYIYNQQLPQASHARPVASYNGALFGGFGNFTNDSWKIEAIQKPAFTLSDYLVQWYINISEVNRPSSEPVDENTLMDIIGPYCDFAAVSTLENSEQRLMPLMTTSGMPMTNVGANIDFNGYNHATTGYIIDNFNANTDVVNTATDNVMVLFYITAASGTGVCFGALTSTNNGTYMWPNDSGTIYTSLNSQNEVNNPTINNTGLKGIRRTNNTHIDIIDGNTITNKAQNATGVPNFPSHILGFNNNNTGNAQHYAGFVAGVFRIRGDADYTTIKNAITNYFTAKGL